MGQHEIPKCRGGSLSITGVSAVVKFSCLPFFTNIIWGVFGSSIFFYESFARQKFLRQERTNDMRQGQILGAETPVILESSFTTGVSPEIGRGKHWEQSLSEEEWEQMQRIVGRISFNDQPRVGFVTESKGKSKRELRELRRLQSSINYESTQRRLLGGKKVLK